MVGTPLERALPLAHAPAGRPRAPLEDVTELQDEVQGERLGVLPAGDRQLRAELHESPAADHGLQAVDRVSRRTGLLLAHLAPLEVELDDPVLHARYAVIYDAGSVVREVEQQLDFITCPKQHMVFVQRSPKVGGC